MTLRTTIGGEPHPPPPIVERFLRISFFRSLFFELDFDLCIEINWASTDFKDIPNVVLILPLKLNLSVCLAPHCTASKMQKVEATTGRPHRPPSQAK